MYRDEDEMEALIRASRRAGISPDALIDYVRRGLIPRGEDGWNEECLAAARRVRRLTALGVNLQGVEVIFHMRRRLIDLQAEIDRLGEERRRAREAHERDVARLLRSVARDAGE